MTKKPKYPFRIIFEFDTSGNRKIKFEGEDEIKNAIMMASAKLLTDLGNKIVKVVEQKFLPKKE